MRSGRFVVVGYRCSWLAILAALAFVPLGCGSDQPATGTQSTPPLESKQANENMLKHMESQKKK